MCIVISSLAFVYGYVLFEDGSNTAGSISIMIGLFFMLLMIRNILETKKRRKK